MFGIRTNCIPSVKDTEPEDYVLFILFMARYRALRSEGMLFFCNDE